MTKITISKVKGTLTESGVDVFFKVLCGQHLVKT